MNAIGSPISLESAGITRVVGDTLYAAPTGFAQFELMGQNSTSATVSGKNSASNDCLIGYHWVHIPYRIELVKFQIAVSNTTTGAVAGTKARAILMTVNASTLYPDQIVAGTGTYSGGNPYVDVQTATAAMEQVATDGYIDFPLAAPTVVDPGTYFFCLAMEYCNGGPFATGRGYDIRGGPNGCRHLLLDPAGITSANFRSLADAAFWPTALGSGTANLAGASAVTSLGNIIPTFHFNRPTT